MQGQLPFIESFRARVGILDGNKVDQAIAEEIWKKVTITKGVEEFVNAAKEKEIKMVIISKFANRLRTIIDMI